MIRHVAMFATGVLFAVGLGIAGMTQPERIIGFLRFGPGWDPTLMFVMMAAIASYVVVFRLTMRRSGPLLATRFMVPTRRDLDARLIGGAILFGVGWGLGGFCPAPAIASLPTGVTSVVVFLAAMLIGMWAFKRFDVWAGSRKTRQAPAAPPTKTARRADVVNSQPQHQARPAPNLPQVRLGSNPLTRSSRVA